MEISLDACSIQPGTIILLYKPYFAYMFSFITFIFYCVLSILIFLQAMRALFKYGMRALQILIFLKIKENTKRFFFFSFPFLLFWRMHTILTILTPSNLVLGCI